MSILSVKNRRVPEEQMGARGEIGSCVWHRLSLRCLLEI